MFIIGSIRLFLVLHNVYTYFQLYMGADLLCSGRLFICFSFWIVIYLVYVEWNRLVCATQGCLVST